MIGAQLLTHIQICDSYIIVLCVTCGAHTAGVVEHQIDVHKEHSLAAKSAYVQLLEGERLRTGHCRHCGFTSKALTAKGQNRSHRCSIAVQLAFLTVAHAERSSVIRSGLGRSGDEDLSGNPPQLQTDSRQAGHGGGGGSKEETASGLVRRRICKKSKPPQSAAEQEEERGLEQNPDDLQHLVVQLARICIRQEDMLNSLCQDTAMILHTSTAKDGLVKPLLQIADKWKSQRLSQPTSVTSPLRLILLRSLLEELALRVNKLATVPYTDQMSRPRPAAL